MDPLLISFFHFFSSDTKDNQQETCYELSTAHGSGSWAQAHKLRNTACRLPTQNMFINWERFCPSIISLQIFASTNNLINNHLSPKFYPMMSYQQSFSNFLYLLTILQQSPSKFWPLTCLINNLLINLTQNTYTPSTIS